MAQVPQYSPFRYPGGKSWFVPTARRWLTTTPTPPRLLVEPFAGGGSVGLAAAIEGLVEEVVLVEADASMAAAWSAILNPLDNAWLQERILAFDCTPNNVADILTATPSSSRAHAFATLVRNRTQFGGILASGAGCIRAGDNNRGVAARWYPDTLARRLSLIAKHTDRIRFIHGDGLTVISEYAADPTVGWFVDPPYVKAGRRLYTHSDVDHGNLITAVANVAGPAVVTYDDDPLILDLAAKAGLSVGRVPMQSGHKAIKYELVLSRDLAWLTSEPAARAA